MRTRRVGGLVRVFAAGCIGLAMAAAPATASAQEPEDECRCVDAEGNEIENCTCFRMPRLGGMAMARAFADARPRLGVSVSAVDNDEGRGARVTDVLDEGPADDAGLREGDVITRIDGRSLLEPLSAEQEEELDLDESLPVQRLLAIARELEPGQEVEIEYLRGDETRTTTVVAEELEPWGGRVSIFGPDWEAHGMRGRTMEDMPAFEWRSGAPDDEGARLLLRRFGAATGGLELAEVNPELGSYFGTEQGVLVLDVDADSRLGLEPGDVILRIGSREATTPERVRRILSSYEPDEAITFDVRRDGRDMSVSGRRGGV